MIPLAVSATMVGVLGLLIGSFLNVVIYRVPAGLSLSRPGSHCPTCDHPIRPWHNVPVLGWVMLRGQCHDCQTRISARYPLVEAGTAALFVATALRFGHDPRIWPAYLYLTAAGVALSLIDLDVQRLPDRIVLPSYLVMAALLAIPADWHAYVRAVEGGAILFALYFAIFWVAPSGMGFGDVKLAGVVGAGMAYVSWGTLLIGGFGAFLLGSVIGIALMLVKRAGRKTAIPFGPFMILGAIIGILGVGHLGDAYLDLLH